MSISFQCPHCGKKLKAPDSAAGKSSSCPGCGGTVTCPVPGDDDEEVVEMQLTPAKPKGFDPFADLDDDKPYGMSAPPPSSMDSGQNRQPCPACGEMIMANAAKCRFCGEVLDAAPAPGRVAKPKSGKKKKRAELKSIAIYQKGVIACAAAWVLWTIVLFVAVGTVMSKVQPGMPANQVVSGSPIFNLLSIVGFGLSIASAVFIFLLCMKVSNIGVAILLLLTNLFCGCLGLISLLIINNIATNRLRDAGISVGFFGADMSVFK